jgi:hypothetical protein
MTDRPERRASPAVLEMRLLEAEEKIRRLVEALEEIQCRHDGNQPPALNMPELDYARRVIREIHRIAQDALAKAK